MIYEGEKMAKSLILKVYNKFCKDDRKKNPVAISNKSSVVYTNDDALYRDLFMRDYRYTEFPIKKESRKFSAVIKYFVPSIENDYYKMKRTMIFTDDNFVLLNMLYEIINNSISLKDEYYSDVQLDLFGGENSRLSTTVKTKEGLKNLKQAVKHTLMIDSSSKFVKQ